MNLNEKKDCITACAGTKVHDCLLLEVGKALAKPVQFESYFNEKKKLKKNQDMSDIWRRKVECNCRYLSLEPMAVALATAELGENQKLK